MFKKYFVPVLCIIFAIVGCIKINIVNTKALSPLGNTEDNFNLVSEEFGEDFSEFIKDKSPIKVYVDEENNGSKVKIGNKEISFTKNNPFLKGVEPVFNYIEEAVTNIKDNFNKNTENNNTQDNNNENNIENNSENNNTKDDSNENSTENNNIKSDEVENEKNVTKGQTEKEEIDKVVDDFINSLHNNN